MPRRHRLKTTVFLHLLLAAMVPVMGVGLLTQWYVSNRIEEGVRLRNQQLARALAGEAEGVLREPLVAMQQTAALLDLLLSRDADEEIRAVLQTLIRTSNAFESVHVADASGIARHSALGRSLAGREEEFAGLDLSGQPAVQQARQSGQTIWSSAYLSPVTGRVTLTLCMPVRGQTLVGSFSIDGLREAVDEAGMDPSIQTAILDHSGTVFFHSDRSIADQRMNLANVPAVRAAMAGREGTVRYDLKGQPHLGSAAPVRGAAWLVLVSQELDHAYASVWHARRVFFGGVLVATLLAAAGAVWLSGRITRPLVQLDASAGAIAAGSYDQAVPAQHCDELEQLAATFRGMAGAIRERERRLGAVFEQAAVGIAQVSPEGRFEAVNQRFCDIVGYSRDELLRMKFQELTHPDDLPEDVRLGRQLRDGSITTYTMRKRYLRRSGLPVWVDLTVSLMRDESDRPEHFLGIVEDITDRMRMEEELRQAQKLEAIGRLAGGVAHDFNNQLAGMVGYTELLMARLQDPELRQYARNVLQGAQRAADLTAKLLAFARKAPSQSVPVDLHRTIAEVASILDRSIDKRIEIRRELDAESAIVVGDPTLLQSSLLNLALNARDAMPLGGVLSFETSIVEAGQGGTPPELAAGRYLCLAVADTGCGMSAQTLERVFEPFFTTKPVGQGTGLGLAAVYGTVQQHRGAITVQSRQEMGSRFTMYLPLAAAVVAPPAEVSRPAAPPPLRIMVVDDQPMFREMIVQMLGEAGHSARGFEDGRSALEFYRGGWRGIDLVILDLSMPGLSGRETFEALRQVNPAARVLLCSGYSLDGEASDLLRNGAAGFLQKPYRLAELEQRMAEAMAGVPAAITASQA